MDENTMNPDQTAPKGTAWSGFSVCNIGYKKHKKMRADYNCHEGQEKGFVNDCTSWMQTL